MNTKQTLKALVVASSATAIAFFAFKVYKTYKAVKLEIEVTKTQTPVETPKHNWKKGSTITPVTYGKPVEDEYEPSEGVWGVYASPDDMIDDDIEQGVYIDPEDEREVEEMRFPPDSKDALWQYREMILAEFPKASPERNILIRLHDIPYKPTTKMDSMIHEYITEDRRAFFGESKHTNQVSMTDFILYYANMLDFDLGMGIAHWADILLRNLGLTPGMGGVTLDNTFEELLNHHFVTWKGFGLFCLSDDQYAEMMSASSNSSDRTVTFNIQYHTYLKTLIDNYEENPIVTEEEEEWY